MTTLAKRGAGTPTTSGTTWTTTTNAVDGTPPANPATYAVWTSSTSGATAYIEVTGYDFSTIPTGSTINSVTMKLRHFENNITRIPTVALQMYDGATTIGASLSCTAATGARDDSAVRAPTLTQLKSGTFKVRATATRAAVTQSATFNVDHIDVTVDYTEPVPSITQAAYRFYADGTETGSTALGTQSTAYTADLSGGDLNLGLRVRLQSTDATTVSSTDDWQLQWDKNASGTWANVAGTFVFDGYDESNFTSGLSLLSTNQSALAQSFMGDGQSLSRAGFWLSKVGSPSGNLTAQLFAHSGTFGTSSLPTGAALATSDPIAASTVGASEAWFDFDFTSPVVLSASTPYCIAVVNDTLDASNYIRAGYDSAAPTHAGNNSYGPGTWTLQATRDAIFRVWRVITGAVVKYDSPNLTDAAATTNRLGAGTGSFVAGEVSETGLVTDLGWSANNYTELLFSITLKQADLADSDTLTFRVLRNGATTGLTYTSTPTVAITAGAGLTAVGKTIQALWSDQAPVGDTVQALWGTRATRTDSVQALWNTRVPAADTVQAVWSIRAPAADTIQAIWNVVALAVPTPIGKTIQALWNDRAAVADTVQVLWPVRLSLGDTINPRWNTRTFLGDAVDARWATRTPAGDTINPRWATRALAGDSINPRWNTRTFLGDAVALRWPVRTTVADTVNVQWNVITLLVTTPIGDVVGLVWADRATLGDTINARWNTRMLATDTVSARWNVLALLITTPIGDVVQLQWGTRTAVADTTQALWRIRAAIGDTVQALWRIRAAAGDTVQVVWDVNVLIVPDVHGTITTTVTVSGITTIPSPVSYITTSVGAAGITTSVAPGGTVTTLEVT